MNIAIIDDQEVVRYSVSKTLKKAKHKTFEFSGLESDIIDSIKSNKIDLLIVDVMLDENFSGIDLLKKFRQRYINQPAILMTAYTTPTNMIEASKIGIKDILQKPFSKENLINIVEKYNSKKYENIHTLSNIDEEFVGSFETMGKVYEKIGIAANNDLPIMILGDTGSGKELIANLIHKNSSRSRNKIVAINCASIPKELFESQLFGHEKGSFTDAVKDHMGLAEAVGEGTLFLDEIGELDISLQSKLLRFLETKKFRRVGSNVDISFKGRIISATNLDITKQINQKNFREDLYYRLSVLTIHVPSLEERKSDIPMLVKHFIKKANQDLKLHIKGISNEAMIFFEKRIYKGNIRELRNLVYNCVLNAQENIIELNSIKNIESGSSYKPKNISLEVVFEDIIEENGIENIKTTLEFIEKTFFKTILKKSSNISHLSTYLGISRNTLRKILKKYELIS